MNLVLPLIASFFLLSLGVHAESDQRVLLNREGEAVCRLADKVGLGRPLSVPMEMEFSESLDECSHQQILSALAEASPEEIQAASAGLVPIVVGLGAAPAGCLVGTEINSTKDDPPKGYFRRGLENLGVISVVGSALAMLHLTGRELLHTLKTGPGKGPFWPRKPYLTALAGLGAGAFGTSFLCYILSSSHSSSGAKSVLNVR